MTPSASHRPRPKPARPWRAPLLLALLGAWLLGPGQAPAEAGLLLRPTLSVGVGYDSNVRLRAKPVGDGYASVTPGVNLEAGPPENRLVLAAQASYNQYFSHNELSQWDGGRLSARWLRRLSEKTTLTASNVFSATYDQAELDEGGQLIQVRDDSGRRDRNTTALRLIHLLGPRSSLSGGYTYSLSTSSSDNVESAVYHRGELGWQQALGPDYSLGLNADASHDDFERSADTNRGGLGLRLARLLSQVSEVYLFGRTGMVRSLSDDEALREARSYDTYTARVGYKSQLTQRLSLDASLGGTMVEGDRRANSASGSVYPSGDLSLNYRGQTWLTRVYANASLGEYEALGQNSGLTDTRRVGTSFSWTPRRHWRLFGSADLVFDDYKQDPNAAGTTGTGDVESIRLSALLSRQLGEHWWASLEYVYLNRDAERDQDDREQNRILLTINTEWPLRW